LQFFYLWGARLSQGSRKCHQSNDFRTYSNNSNCDTTMNSWLDTRDKGRNVVAHHFSPHCPGSPLFLMIPGGVAAAIAGVWIFVLAKAIWVELRRAISDYVVGK